MSILVFACQSFGPIGTRLLAFRASGTASKGQISHICPSPIQAARILKPPRGNSNTSTSVTSHESGTVLKSGENVNTVRLS
jgi:hypothetical protein